MILARVEGSIVATKKHEKISGRKILLVRPLVIDSPDQKELREGKTTLAAFDDLGAGQGEVVLVVQGSSARLGSSDRNLPVDAMVIGIVDNVTVARKHALYQAS